MADLPHILIVDDSRVVRVELIHHLKDHYDDPGGERWRGGLADAGGRSLDQGGDLRPADAQAQWLRVAGAGANLEAAAPAADTLHHGLRRGNRGGAGQGVGDGGVRFRYQGSWQHGAADPVEQPVEPDQCQGKPGGRSRASGPGSGERPVFPEIPGVAGCPGAVACGAARYRCQRDGSRLRWLRRHVPAPGCRGGGRGVQPFWQDAGRQGAPRRQSRPLRHGAVRRRLAGYRRRRSVQPLPSVFARPWRWPS